jgi:glycosyltransferase involved in cell wall biosynthesis
MPSDFSTSRSSHGSIGLSVIVPVYNEEATLGVSLERVLALPVESLEAIVIDDGSTDRTLAIIAEAARADQRIRAIRLAKNSGKTTAVREGIQLARGRVIIIQDADLEYDAAEIPRLIKPIVSGEADVVYGSRLLDRPSRGAWPFWHYWGNRAITALSNCFMRWRVTDVETCYKAFRAPILKNLSLSSKRFGMEIELTALASRTKARFLELPISYAPRNVSEGKKIRFSDGMWAIYYIVRYNALNSWTADARRYVQSTNRALGEAVLRERSEGSCETAGRSSDALTTIPSSS